MKYKVDDLLNILNKSMKIFQITENDKYFKETDDMIKILENFRGEELDGAISNSKKYNKVNKVNYENLYEIIVKVKNNVQITDSEKDYLNDYLEKNSKFRKIIIDNDENYIYKLDEDVKNYSSNDLQLIYRILTDNVIKTKKKDEILNELKNVVYQKKYYSDLDERFDKSQNNIQYTRKL